MRREWIAANLALVEWGRERRIERRGRWQADRSKAALQAAQTRRAKTAERTTP